MFLIVGGESEIGGAVRRHLADAGLAATATTRRRELVAADRPLLDLSHAPGDWPVPPGTEAACICAAVARVADCAADPIGSARINVEHSVALIERLVARGIHVLYLSTNQVFDGSSPHVVPEAPTSPVSAYGRQKARTEAALLAHLQRGAPVAILRLSKVVSPGIDLLRGWAEALGAGRRIRAFADMMMAPVPIDLVAAAIDGLLRARAGGVYQLSGPEDVSYVEIGRHIADRIGAPAALVEPVTAASAGMQEGSTPRHTTLDSARLGERFGIRVPPAWAVLDAALGLGS